jgi:hypothetical protein
MQWTGGTPGAVTAAAAAAAAFYAAVPAAVLMSLPLLMLLHATAVSGADVRKQTVGAIVLLLHNQQQN